MEIVLYIIAGYSVVVTTVMFIYRKKLTILQPFALRCNWLLNRVVVNNNMVLVVYNVPTLQEKSKTCQHIDHAINYESKYGLKYYDLKYNIEDGGDHNSESTI